MLLRLMDRRLPPSPPIRHRVLGHLHDIRTEGFVRFMTRCVAEHGPLVLLRLGPPVVGRRMLLVADPEVARLTLTQDLQRRYPPGIGPMQVFGKDAVFCTDAADALHAQRQQLITRHLEPDMLRHHAATMAELWPAAFDEIVSIPAGMHSVTRRNINDAVWCTVQRVAIRCWMGVEPTSGETHDTLHRYVDTGNLLNAVLFDTWFFLHARRRVAGLRTSYAPLLARSLAAVEAAAPQARFIAESLDQLGWDRRRLTTDDSYRLQLLAHLPFYRHLFTVMLPSMGSIGGTLLFLIRQLAADTQTQDRLRSELAEADLLTTLRAPPVTAAAIRECLRLYPEAAGIPRTLRTSRCYGGYVVPKGTMTFTQLYTLHRNPCRHADPERFDVSRDLTAEDGGWLSFSRDPLACVGRRFAELQLAVALQALLGRYRLAGEPVDPSAHNDYQGSVTLQPEPFSVTFSMSSP